MKKVSYPFVMGAWFLLLLIGGTNAVLTVRAAQAPRPDQITLWDRYGESWGKLAEPLALDPHLRLVAPLGQFQRFDPLVMVAPSSKASLRGPTLQITFPPSFQVRHGLTAWALAQGTTYTIRLGGTIDPGAGGNAPENLGFVPTQTGVYPIQWTITGVDLHPPVTGSFQVEVRP